VKIRRNRKDEKTMAINKKAFVATIAIVLALLLLAGTFAWQQMVSKVNEFIGKRENVVLHDDFNGCLKDVYVENTGTGEIYIRIKLKETMKLNSSTWRPGANDWIAHVYGNSAVDCGHRNIADNLLFHDYFKWTMGGQKYYMPGSTDSSGTLSQDNTVYNASTPGVKQTPYINPSTQIIRWEVYRDMTDAQRAAFNGWIYDSDGYVYWSKPLQPGTATGLLLHKVDTVAALKNKEYYYAIDVILEAVDIEDIPMWSQGAASVDGSGKRYPIAAHPAIINSIKAFAAQLQVFDAEIPAMAFAELDEFALEDDADNEDEIVIDGNIDEDGITEVDDEITEVEDEPTDVEDEPTEVDDEITDIEDDGIINENENEEEDV